MSLLKSNSVQIGQSATATQNFTLSVPSSPDGTIKLARGNSGATTADVLSINASGVITGSTFSGPTISGATINSSTVNGGSITSGTAVASTSGTAIDFTGIPSWVKRITVMFNGVSSNGATDFQIQIGSGTMSTASYASVNAFAGISGGYATSTSGLLVNVAIGAGNSSRGIAILSLIGSNTWVYSSVLNRQDGYMYTGSGSSPALAGSLDRVRITAGGTDTFDAGSINIMYEG